MRMPAGDDRLTRHALWQLLLALALGISIALSQVPSAPPASKTILDEDREFDAGSKIVLKDLTDIQVANLALLGKVWGFLKYHHPSITAGQRHWDYELFRIAPRVLAAVDTIAAQRAMHQWITGLGPVPACDPCANLDERELHLSPPTTWLRNEILGAELGETLRGIHRNRPAGNQQFYLSLTPGIGNPRFDNEPAYANLRLPDHGYQLLALFRLWNIIEYWFPYRDLIDGSWDDELRRFIPRIAGAADAESYSLEMMQFIVRLQDTHANLWSALALRPPAGSCHVPVHVRMIERRPLVAGYLHETLGPATGLEPGDLVETVEGEPVTTIVEKWAHYYAASNEPTRMRDIGRFLLRGTCGAVSVRVRRGDKTIELKPERVPRESLVPTVTNDRPGPTLQKLSGEVAYLKLSSVKVAEAASYIEAAAGTRGLVIDIRNYPSEFVVFALGSRLVDKPTPFARFTIGDPANPGAFRFTPPVSLGPVAPRYEGKIVVLVDETSQSQSEYTAMALRSAPNAIVIGSTTAGADGNVSPIPLPGGLRTMISGIGVFYPDKKPTQRIGIIPDIEVIPTIEGIRSRRDEVLEAALKHILGSDVPASEIERLARR